MSDNYPKTKEDFVELREYLSFLQDELQSFNATTITEEQLEHYTAILYSIEVCLELAELNILDHVTQCDDAKSVLSTIFSKPIL